jgi:hypothetical protein
MKQALKSAVLTAIGFLFSGFGTRLHAGSFFTQKDKTLIDRARRAYINRRYYSADDATKERMNRSLFWGGAAALKWHAGTERDTEKLAVFRMLVSDLALNTKSETLIEIGCGSGFQLAKLADEVKTAARFVGIDLNADQIATCRNKYPRLEFYSGDGCAWIAANCPRHAIIVCIGTLEYFSQGQVAELMQLARERRCAIAMLEPVNGEPEESTPRGNLAYSHNYKRLAKMAGLSVLESRREGVDVTLALRS